jgi:hypothetical protein
MGGRMSVAMEQLSNDHFYFRLYPIRQKLAPEQLQHFDMLNPRQLRGLAVLVDERPDGFEWAAKQFDWIHLLLTKYVR